MATRSTSEQRAIDTIVRSESRLRTAAINAIVAARGVYTQAELIRLISQGLIDEAVEAAARAGAIEMAGASAGVYFEAGADRAAELSDILRVRVEFDVVDDRAVNYIRRNRVQLIQEFTQTQREAVREALREGVEQGLNPRVQARRFRDSIGLTARQERAVRRYEAMLRNAHNANAELLNRTLRDRRFDRTLARARREGKPLTAEQIRKMTQRYRERYIKYRAETIARTEALRSVNMAQRHTFEEVVEQGHVAADELQREWVATLDNRTRPDHLAANGQKVGLLEPFVVGGYEMMQPGDPNAPAEQTINCRCTTVLHMGDP